MLQLHKLLAISIMTAGVGGAMGESKIFIVEGKSLHRVHPMCLRGSPPKPPAPDQKSFGAKNHGADHGSIRKVRPLCSNQSGDAEGNGHKKPESCAHSGAQPYVLIAAQQEHSRSQQLAPRRFPSRFDQGYDRRISHTVNSSRLD